METTNSPINMYKTTHHYFCNLNIITKKIEENINETKSKYTEELWNRLNENEKNSIIDDELIKPEISLKYFQDNDDDIDINNLLLEKNNCSFDGRNLHTYNAKLKLPNKIIANDYGMYRDEHSAPFSFKTKSQINLNLFNTKQEATYDASDELDSRRPIPDEIRAVAEKQLHKHAKKGVASTKYASDILAAVTDAVEHPDHNPQQRQLPQQVLSPQTSLKANLNVNFLTKLFKKTDVKDEDSTLLILQSNSLDYEESNQRIGSITSNVENERSVEQTDIDDQKSNNYNEFNSLLEDYDFLNNW